MWCSFVWNGPLGLAICCRGIKVNNKWHNEIMNTKLLNSTWNCLCYAIFQLSLPLSLVLARIWWKTNNKNTFSHSECVQTWAIKSSEIKRSMRHYFKGPKWSKLSCISLLFFLYKGVRIEIQGTMLSSYKKNMKIKLWKRNDLAIFVVFSL